MKILFIITIFIIGSLALVGYYVSEYGTFDGIKLYSSDKYGISFSYPKKYFLIEKLQSISNDRYHYAISLFEDTEFNRKLVTGEVVGTEGPVSITFDIYQNNLDKKSLLGWMNNSNVSNFKLGDGKHSLIEISGKEAVRYTWDGLYNGETVAFISGDNIVAMSVTYDSSEDDIKKDFEKVLLSIKFK